MPRTARPNVLIERERHVAARALEQMTVPAQHEDAAVRVPELFGDRLDRHCLASTGLIGRRDHEGRTRVPKVVEGRAVERCRLVASHSVLAPVLLCRPADCGTEYTRGEVVLVPDAALGSWEHETAGCVPACKELLT